MFLVLLYLAPNGVPPMWMVCSFPIAIGGIIMHVYFATISNIRDATCIVQRPLEIRHSRMPSLPLITVELDTFIESLPWYYLYVLALLVAKSVDAISP